MDQTINTTAEHSGPKTGRIFPWVAGGALAALGVSNVYTFNKIDDLNHEVAQYRQTSTNELIAMKESAQATAQANQQTLAELNSHFEEGSKSSTAAAQKLAAQAQRNAEKLVKDLAAAQAASNQEIQKSITDVKTVADAHTAQVAGLETNVTSVKDEVTKTKSILDETIANLGTMRGDLGVQSGLIATNAKELQALRDLGDRSYYEFTIRKGAGPAKVGNMTVELKKSDVKRNKYNINIVADDKRVEKKDRTINEPVQMYVSGNRQPYEIVVNDVQKDAIVGYLAVPKVLQSRR